MTFKPKTPQYVIPTDDVGVVVYRDKKAVGFQFADPAGGHIFVSLPGKLLPVLAEALRRTAEKEPEVLNWQPAPYSGPG